MSAAAETNFASIERRHTSGAQPKRDIVIVRGDGSRVWDVDGNEYLDFTSGHGVASLGHRHPKIVAAIADQSATLITCSEGFYNDSRARFLERLTDYLPPELDRVFLSNSGAEAVETALKLARLATGRQGVVATMRGFHGRTFGALSATWERRYREAFEPLVPGFTHVPFDDCEAASRTIGDDTAAFLVEIVQGEGGVRPGSTAYFEHLRRVCDERGAILVVDEVQTGFGRTGRWFAFEHHGIVPDIVCLGKAIAGGIPMGATAFSRSVPTLPAGSLGSTFGGNPLACAAGAAAIEAFASEHLVEQSASLGRYLKERLASIDSPVVRDVRGLGLMVGIELRVRVAPLVGALQREGVLALAAGPTVLRLLPPLVVTRDEIDTAVDAIGRVFSRINADGDEESI